MELSNEQPSKLPCDSQGSKPVKRSIFIRSLIGCLWFFSIYFISDFIIGGIVGGIAGSKTSSFAEGAAAGQAASVAFFRKFGLPILVVQVFLTLFLIFAEVLPGTGKHKKVK